MLVTIAIPCNMTKLFITITDERDRSLEINTTVKNLHNGWERMSPDKVQLIAKRAVGESNLNVQRRQLQFCELVNNFIERLDEALETWMCVIYAQDLEKELRDTIGREFECEIYCF